MADRAFRSLENLERSASTARVLNLLQVARDHRLTQAWLDRPFFLTPELNSSLLVKHRLRRNEYDAFRIPRQVATKVLVPIDRRDLKTGGRYVFVGQINYEQTMAEVFGITTEHPDFTTLGIIDRLPSLDPFLLREQLAQAGLTPAPCYFSISESDLQQMLDFVKIEISPLMQLSLGSIPSGPRSIERMALKIISSTPADWADALGQTLRLRPDEYQECLFCWRGLLYYKWVMDRIMKQIVSVFEKIATLKPVGPLESQTREYITRSQSALRLEIAQNCLEIMITLTDYDLAYRQFTKNGNPAGFRKFLLDAPQLFARLGEQIGALQHIVSFSNYRFKPRASPPGGDELMDILMDFEASLQRRDHSHAF